jgi:uncharacterized protein YkwD
LAGIFTRVFTASVVGIASLIFATATFAASFPDVASLHPNAAAIDYLTKEGILAGYPDGSFQPENPVNRAEALKILMLATGEFESLPGKKTFPDIGASDWFSPFVNTANARGVADGYPDGFFRPEQTVNLVEALKMLLQAATVDSTNYKTNRKLFADTYEGAWYNQFLAYADAFDLVSANRGNQILPATPLTRAKLSEIVYRFIKRVERVCPGLLETTKTVPPAYFQGITLSSELPNLFYENEVFPLQGSVASNVTDVTAFYADIAGVQTAFSTKAAGGSFAQAIQFTTPGHYNFSILPNLSGSSYAMGIEVLPRECNPTTTNTASQIPTGLRFVLEKNIPTLRWDDSANNITRVVLHQGSKNLEYLVTANQNQIELNPADFTAWQTGEATVQIFGAVSAHGWSFEPRSAWASSVSLSLNLAQHYFSDYLTEQISISDLPIWRNNQVSLSVIAKTALETDAFLITPAGLVEEVPILKNTEAVPAGSRFNLNLSLPQSGTYILELNNTAGLPVLNHPLYEPGTAPLLPDYNDLREAPVTGRTISANRERSIWLRLINEFRARYKLPALILDDAITNFSQAYAQRMAQENFFGHTDPQGRSPDARRIAAGLSLPVGENLARDSETVYAHEGLLRSATHRANILGEDWSRVGLGIALDARNNMLFAQHFSASPLTSATLPAERQRLLTFINEYRAAKGLSALALDLSLEPAVQAWSEKMLTENFFDFVNGSESLQASIRATGFSGSFASFITSSSRITGLAKSLQQEDSWQTPSKTRVAIGITQKADGMLLATFVFR